MPIAMSTTKKPTMSQPQMTATGPAVVERDEVRRQQPARIEMIVNEMAKFESRPSRGRAPGVAELVERVLVVVVPLNPGASELIYPP